MTAVVRLNDLSAGHCFIARPNDEASSDVIVNNKGVHRLGDHWVIHCCGDPCHDGNLSEGSPNVFINGKKCGRVGDSISCGDMCAQGSPNVICN